MKTLVLCLVLLLQQKDDSARIWRNVGAYQPVTSDDDRPLSGAQVEAIRKTLKTNKEIVDCDGFEPADSVLQKLTFDRLQLSPNHETVLVQAGPGCLRGGQGSNGSMWIVRLDRGRVTVLASPAGDFAGYVYSVPPTTSKGYRDIVVGWHLSAFEAGLAYFRFDGAQYRKVSRATFIRDRGDGAKESIIPAGDR